MPWHRPRVLKSEGDAVILLHGLWRSVWAMEPMAKFLHQQGYHTVNVPYPSFRKPTEELTRIIHDTIREHSKKGQRIHFVTHSLGGVLTRRLLAQLPADHSGRVVMLAPPNQGCEIVDWLRGCKPLMCTLGPAGADLGYNAVDAPPVPDKTDTAVIMGNRSVIPFFRTFLAPDNDGIVSVESGRIEGMNEFHVLDTDHTFIASDSRVLEMTARFLKHGKSQR